MGDGEGREGGGGEGMEWKYKWDSLAVSLLLLLTKRRRRGGKNSRWEFWRNPSGRGRAAEKKKGIRFLSDSLALFLWQFWKSFLSRLRGDFFHFRGHLRHLSKTREREKELSSRSLHQFW